MASELFGQRFRANVGDPGGVTPVFPNEEVDDIGLQAEEAYPGASQRIILIVATMIGFQRLMGSAVKRVSYSQNSASESLSDLPRNLKAAYDMYKSELDQALTEEGGNVRWGSISKFPTRLKGFPDA